MGLCYRTSWETQHRTQLLKHIAGFCRVTPKLGKANLTGLKKAVHWVNPLLWREKGTLHRTRTYLTSLFSLWDTDKHLSCFYTQRCTCINETAVCAPEAQPISRKSPTTTKCLCILREFSKGGVRVEVTSSTAPNPSLEGFLNTLVKSSPRTLRKCCYGHIPLYCHHHHHQKNTTRGDFLTQHLATTASHEVSLTHGGPPHKSLHHHGLVSTGPSARSTASPLLFNRRAA